MWCRQHGMYCKDKNCPHEHLEEAPDCCDAVLRFDGSNHFCFCELDKGHEGEHQALMFKWDGEGESTIHESYRLRGMNLLRAKMMTRLENGNK